SHNDHKMALNVVGLIGIIVFYVLILVVGLWASRKAKQTGVTADSEDVMLAGRNIGMIVGVFTMTATWVGGGYINGTAEAVFTSGIVWCQAPFGYALSLVFALGATISVIMDLDVMISIIVSVLSATVLSAKSSRAPVRRRLSYIAAVAALVMQLPPALIGALASSNKFVLLYNWKLTLKASELGPICSFRSESAASEREVLCVMRVAIFGVGAMATVMGITIESIYGLWFLCADLVYVMLFPQLLAVVHMDFTNTYGSLFAYIVGLVLRLGGGEPFLHLRAFIKYPNYDYVNHVQRFPFRTLSMLVTLAATVGMSLTARAVFERGWLLPRWDVFRCVVNIPEDKQQIGDDDVGEMTVMGAVKATRGYDATADDEASILMANGGKTNKALDVGDGNGDVGARMLPPTYESLSGRDGSGGM
ncbi:PREDICTED: LOW QUALITY PROTEIN: high-affinity choline transporter 1-like, partial [Priapulus caudatus]|uniref:LOW QUALITY PROTEIN: high-affinity choline transporter 1-like n=1 Tax=Priapulus caudatus TaxID=37621 RepID=A0ABM1F4M0_PRICU